MSDSFVPISAPNFGYPCVFNPMETGMLIEDCWPSLYVGHDRTDEIRRKLNTCPWAEQTLSFMKREADAVLAESPSFIFELNGESIGHSGRSRMYNDDGHYLQFDPNQAMPMWNPNVAAFVEPQQGAVQGWVVLQHERIRRLITSLARLGVLFDEPRYRAWAWNGLRNLAERYEEYAKTHDSEATPYRYFYGGMYEAQCQLQVIQAMELLENAPEADAADVERIKQVVIRPGNEAIRRWMGVMMVHNMSAWSMASLAEAGRYLGEQEWIDTAFHSERCGLTRLLEYGLPDAESTGKPDGFWFEHAPFYGCFYVAISITSLVRAADEAGVLSDDLRARYATFFDAMPHLVDSELRILSISDRVAPETMRLTQTRHFYEYAAGQVDERHGELLALLYSRCGGRRDSWAALAYGPDELPAPKAPKNLSESCTLPAAGMTTFRATTPTGGGATMWFQNLTAYRGGAQGHHHMDKLSYTLHADGAVVTSDLGWPGCESKESGRAPYLSGTLSHNTTMLNECDQGAVEAIRFVSDLAADVPYAHGAFRGDAEFGLQKVFRDHHFGRLEDDLYEDAVIARTVWFDYPRIVILDTLTADSEKRFGAFFHGHGQMVFRHHAAEDDRLRAMPALPDDGAWAMFKGRHQVLTNHLTVDWRPRGDIYARLTTTADAAFEATLGGTQGNPVEHRRGSVFVRSPGAQRIFASVLEIHGGTPQVAKVEISGAGVNTQDFDGTARSYAAPIDR